MDLSSWSLSYLLERKMCLSFWVLGSHAVTCLGLAYSNSEHSKRLLPFSHLRSSFSLNPIHCFFFFKQIFIWQYWVLIVPCGTFSLCDSMWDLCLWHMGSSFLTRDQTDPPSLAAWSLSHWTTREVLLLLDKFSFVSNLHSHVAFSRRPSGITVSERHLPVTHTTLLAVVSSSWWVHSNCLSPYCLLHLPHGHTQYIVTE